VCVCVRIRTHTHTAHGVLDVSPGVGMRHLEGPNNPDEPNLGMYAFVCVYKVKMCVYAGRRGETWTNCFLSPKKHIFSSEKAKQKM